MDRRLASTLACCFASLALVGAAASGAAAYCRTTTIEPALGSDPSQCPDRGLPLFWPQRTLRYTVNRRGFPDLTQAELRDVLDRSFGAWLQVDCGEQPIDLSIEQTKHETEIEPDDHVPAPRPNLVVHVAAEDWQDDPRAFAITNLRFNSRTGHILGADMVFNGGKDPFTLCDEGACEDGQGTDLPNVVTHEAGHFLGLAHSDDPDSTMWHDAKANDTDKRSLEEDDREGICAIYGPGVEPGPPPSNEDPVSGVLCSAGQPSGRSGGWCAAVWLGLGLASLGWAGRRR